MSTIDLQKRLFEKIQKTENKELLEEAYRLLALESEDSESYKLSDSQHEAIEAARQQIKIGQAIPAGQADNEIDEWLNK